MADHGVRQVRSFCRVCQALCGIVVTVDGERIVKVAGDPDHSVSAGYTCGKGRALPELHHDPKRLETPMRRDANGTLRDTTWDDALDEITAKLGELRIAPGANAIGAYRGTHYYFDAAGAAVSDQFFRSLGTPQMYSPFTLDTPSKFLVPHLLLGIPTLFAIADWAATDLVLLVGQNTVVSHGHTTSRPDPVSAIRRVRSRGGAVIVVDPRRTETTRLADLHVQLRPGSDAALLAFLVREALTTSPDRAYLDAVAAPGSEEALAEAVAPYDAGRVATTCGIEPAVLDELVARLRSARRLSFQSGTGTSMSAAPNVSEWLGWALAVVTGSLDRPGGTLFNPGCAFPKEHAPNAVPGRPSGPPPASRPELMHAFGEYPSAVMADEILAGELRALFCLGGNPATVFPDSAKTVRALRSLDLFVVCDVRPTETTALATHVLPVCGQLERPDIPLAADSIFPFPFTQYTEAIVGPVGNRRPMFWVFSELGARLDIPLFGDHTLDEHLRASGPTADAIIGLVASGSRVPFETMRATPGGVQPDTAPSPGWLVPDLLPTGRIDLAPPEMRTQLREWADRANGASEILVLLNRRLPRTSNSVLRDSTGQRERGPAPVLLMHPLDADHLDVHDGDEIDVVNDTGSTPARIGVTESIPVGAVSLPHGWSSPCVNALTSTADVDPLTGMPRYSGFPVTIRPRS